jgi:2-methylisocitrate lyase-like PEP mutase family enzyme
MNTQVSRAEALRAKLDVARPAIAMAARNPLAAKLATDADFDAVWRNGFELSASYVAPDANILSKDIHLAMMPVLRRSRRPRRAAKEASII